MKGTRFLIIPCVREGKGSGHLKRSIALRRSLEARGAVAILSLGGGGNGERGSAELCAAFSIGPGEWMDPRSVQERDWDVAVFDNFSTPWKEFEAHRRLSFCVGIDEGGPPRGAFDYLIDILPRLDRKDPPNMADALAFLDFPSTAREFPAEIRKILVSMGGEDAQGLGIEMARVLSPGIAQGRISVDLLRGPLAADGAPTYGARALKAFPDLKAHLAEYDLVICQFGLTAYEAAASGTGVLLLNPGRYHEELSVAAGFPSLGVKRPDPRKLESYLADPGLLHRESGIVRGKLDSALAAVGKSRGPGALADHLLSLDLPPLSPRRACVACHAEKKTRTGKALWRDQGRGYFPCPVCSSARMARTSANPIHYGEDYFFEEYRRQYGKTYLEDFPSLRRMAGERLRRIGTLSGGLAGKRVLDVGCAYGAFLLEARESGAVPFGIDPAPEAVGYVRANLGIEAIRGFFPNERLRAIAEERPFDIACLWYVAEHLGDLAAALGEIRCLLRKGGILALSTPSGSGVSARFSRDSFFRSSPMDHASILSPASVRRVFADSGFRFRALRSTGHHPERLPLRRRVTGGPGYAMLLAASRLFALGDTFEAYASRI